jgi:hypothetical protein
MVFFVIQPRDPSVGIACKAYLVCLVLPTWWVDDAVRMAETRGFDFPGI